MNDPLVWDANRHGDLAAFARGWAAVLAREPDNADALNMLGAARFFQGRLDEAEQQLRLALSLANFPSAELLGNFAILTDAARRRRSGPSLPLALSRERDAARLALHCETIVGPQRVVFPPLAGYGFPTDADPRQFQGTGQTPEVRAFRLAEAIVDADCGIAMTREAALLPEPVDLSTQLLWEEHERIVEVTGPTTIRLALRPPALRAARVESAVVLTSPWWSNWAHFVTELLPKALLADRIESWRDRPFLIGAHRLLNAESMLRALLRPGRRVLRAAGRLQVGDAAYVSCAGFSPYEYRYDWHRERPRIRPADCLFSPAALALLRETARDRLAPDVPVERKLYLRRTGGVRRLLNSDEIEAAFVAQGFEPISPETLPAEDQVRTFAAASAIAGPTGAALANMIFAPPGCRVIPLYAYSPHANYHYFCNLAAALGHRLHWVLGRAAPPRHHPAHFDFSIDAESVRRALADG